MTNRETSFLTMILLLGLASAARAQDLPVQEIAPLALRFEAAESGSNPPFASERAKGGLATAVSAPSISREAAAEPGPAFACASNDKDFCRWQLGVGYQFVRFRSAAIDASLNGLRTSLTYYVNNSVGVEGSVVAAFGSSIFSNEHPKYLLYTGGPIIVWPRRGWSPWGHALIGGLHMLPQVAGGFSHNSFAVQIGGGADYRLSPQFFFRLDGDYVRTQLYATSQNNFQFGAGFTFQF